jgi:hypothetical protein
LSASEPLSEASSGLHGNVSNSLILCRVSKELLIHLKMRMKKCTAVRQSSAKFKPGSQYLNFHQAWVVSDVQNRQMFHFCSSYRTFVILLNKNTLFLVMVYSTESNNVFKALNLFCKKICSINSAAWQWHLTALHTVPQRFYRVLTWLAVGD